MQIKLKPCLSAMVVTVHETTFSLMVLQEVPPKPDVPGLTQYMWATTYDMEDMLFAFKGITRDLTATPVWVRLGDDILVRFHVDLIR